MTTFDSWAEAVKHDRTERKKLTRAEYGDLAGLTPGVIQGAENDRRMKKSTIEALLPLVGDLLPEHLGGTTNVAQATPQQPQPMGSPVETITTLRELENVRAWLAHRYEQVLTYADQNAGVQLDLGKISGRPPETPNMAEPSTFQAWASWLDVAEQQCGLATPEYRLPEPAPVQTEPALPAESKIVDLMAALEESVREAKDSRARHPQPVPAAFDVSGDWVPVQLDDDGEQLELFEIETVSVSPSLAQGTATPMLSDLELQLHDSIEMATEFDTTIPDISPSIQMQPVPVAPADGAVVVQGPWQQFDPPQRGRREPDKLVLDSALRYVTNGELQTFSDCRRRWWLEYHRKVATGARSVVGAAPLGTRVHQALSVLYVPDGEDSGDPLGELAWTVADDKAYLESVNASPKLFAALEAEHDFAQIIIEGYLQWVEETGADAAFKVLSSERGLAVNPGFPGMENVRLLSKEDTRLLRNQDGAVVFIDHKVVSNFDQLTGWAHMNRQFIHYGLVEFLLKAEQQFAQQGDIPSEIRTVDGAMLNMLRKIKRTATAKPPFYHRHTVRFNSDTFRSYWRQVLGTLRQIIETGARLDAGGDHQELCPPRPTSDCSWKCQFFVQCSLFDDGSDAERLVAETMVTVDPLKRYEPQLSRFIE